MLKRSILARTALGAAAAAMSLTSLLAAPTLAAAQSVDVPVPPRTDAPPPSYGPQNQGYGGQQDQGYAQQGSNSQAERDYARQRAEYDRRYADWARQNCEAKKGGSTAFGAIAGGILGAVVGSQLSGRGDRTAGSLIGGGLGAVAGGAIGSSAGDKCPEGYAYAPRGASGYYGPPPPQGPPGPPPRYYDDGYGYGPPPPPPYGYDDAPAVYEAPPPVVVAPPYYGFGLFVGPRWGGGGWRRHW
jgi:hypothetical protein